MKWPGKPTPTTSRPPRVATAMATAQSVMGMPVRRSRTSLKKLLRGS